MIYIIIQYDRAASFSILKIKHGWLAIKAYICAVNLSLSQL
ncbi:hypothetical protein [Ferruginibacter sp.]